ncbi:MAG: helix-turn-helix domain-containing protein [Alphaproteobacteria bacterium]|nr:helix-turn-helix domain-containing protein [Alphaproteobacteria bacterium]
MEKSDDRLPPQHPDARVDQADGDSDRGQPAAPPVPHHFRFSTRDIAPEGKFETWRDLWLRLAEVEVSTGSFKDFDGEVDLWNAGPLSIAGTKAQASRYGRSTRQANHGSNEFSLTLCRVNGNYSTAKVDRIAVQRGGAFLISHDRPFDIAAPDNRLNDVLLIDRQALLELMPKGFDLDAQTFASEHHLLGVIRNMLPLVTSKTEPTTDEQRAAIGRQVVDLVALLLNPSRDGRELIEQRGLKAARLGAVLRAIDSRFDDVSLSTDGIGHELGISGRQVHRLLEWTTKTFYEHLLERRLQRAHELLSNPSLGEAKTGTVAAIAAQVGFTNVTHFNRLFRARFGDTPTGVRTNPLIRRS